MGCVNSTERRKDSEKSEHPVQFTTQNSTNISPPEIPIVITIPVAANSQTDGVSEITAQLDNLHLDAVDSHSRLHIVKSPSPGLPTSSTDEIPLSPLPGIQIPPTNGETISQQVCQLPIPSTNIPIVGTRPKKRSVNHESAGYVVTYPPHPERKATALYVRTHKHLCIRDDIPCWVCGSRTSQGISMETHHFFCEEAMMLGIDWTEFGKKAKYLYNPQSGENLGAAFDWELVAKDPSLFVDSPSNMVVLCPEHHRLGATGIHHIPFPEWITQVAPKPGFTPVKAIK